jgi:hypothetical protein
MLGAANGRFVTGTYQNVWSFASRSSNFSAAFDGARFQGMNFANSNSGNFNTRGPFQAGFFSVRGPRYVGGGAYLGEKR